MMVLHANVGLRQMCRKETDPKIVNYVKKKFCSIEFKFYPLSLTFSGLNVLLQLGFIRVSSSIDI
jgi:hypothetical protein